MKILVGILLSAFLSTQQTAPAQDQVLGVSTTFSEPPIEILDPHCKTPELHPDEVERLIRETQTMDLNFVALAKSESGLYNRSKVVVSQNPDYHYRGIFQIYDRFHKLDDYCDPVEQVKWLERKLDEGAKPEKLFPSLYQLLYT